MENKQNLESLTIILTNIFMNKKLLMKTFLSFRFLSWFYIYKFDNKKNNKTYGCFLKHIGLIDEVMSFMTFYKSVVNFNF